MTRRRLNREEEDRIIEAYNAWDPADSPVDDLTAELGIARQTLYRVIERRGVPLKSHASIGVDPQTGVPDDLTLTMARTALNVLVDRLVAAETEIRALRDENAALIDRITSADGVKISRRPVGRRSAG